MATMRADFTSSPPHVPSWECHLARAIVPIALFLTITFITFGFIAFLLYPTHYSPLTHTLSELGNRRINHHGSEFYIIGCVLTGMLVIAYFTCLSLWRRTGTRAQNRLLISVQGLGAISGIGLIMTAVYPQDQLDLHRVWSDVLFNSLGIALFLSLFALRRGHYSRVLVSVAVLAYATDLASFIFAEQHWLEWLTVSVCMVAGYVVAFKTRNLALTNHFHVTPN